MALTITTDGTQTIADASNSSGVVYLSGVSGGAQVSLGVTMSNAETVELDGSVLIRGANVVTHGSGAVLVAITKGSSGTTNLTLDFHTI